jgi:LSD1 subclass zinc finger protein
LIGKKRSFSDAYNDCWYPDIHDKEIVWDKIPKENRIVIGVCLKCGKVEQRKSYKTRSSPSGWAVRNRDCLCGHNLTFNKDLCFREGEKIELKTELTSVVFLRCHSCNSRLDGLLYGRKWIRCGNCHEVNRIKDVESLVVWCETAL